MRKQFQELLTCADLVIMAIFAALLAQINCSTACAATWCYLKFKAKSYT